MTRIGFWLDGSLPVDWESDFASALRPRALSMQAHREKYAAIRRRQREAARTKDEIESREASE